MRQALRLLILTSVAHIETSSAFLPPIADSIQSTHLVGRDCRRREIATARKSAAADDSSELEPEDTKEAGSGLIALPPIGASSFWDRPRGSDDSPDLALPEEGKIAKKKKRIIVSEHTNLVSSKFQLQYTCKVCGTRNSHSVTRMAYRNGVVIAVCKGCLSKHLIADNFGWNKYAGGFDYDNGETNIEMYMANRDLEARKNGMGGEVMNDLVKRVSRDVFDLESILYQGQGMNKSIATGTEEADQIDGGDEMSWR
ncbi:hypothetical protein ACHAW5_007511 [Stephanodiscus triporus]|uniref:DNL-type domain-containing protein n=1 Tax=Stephanodiscus triporus TaxID=2934178 RepID=A0ABD3NY02_9STRA